LAGGVVGWMAHGASAAAPSRFDTFTAQALDAHRVYVVEVRHPVEVTGGERPHLVQWLSKRLDYELRIPELEPSGLKLVGGRLLPGPLARRHSACMKAPPVSALPSTTRARIRRRPPCVTARPIASPPCIGSNTGSLTW